MKIKFWILATALAFATMAHAATNDLTSLLQKGLFDEEANRDLNAAIADYQSVASAFDKNRQLAATAIFRLGECYRKLGQSSEAAAQYQRIIKEFSDQQTLVTLSRQNLAGMGASVPSVAASGNVSDAMQQVQQQIEQAKAQVVKDQALSQALSVLDVAQLRQTLPQMIPDTQLDQLEMRLSQAQQDLIALKKDYSTDHPKYKNAEEIVQELQKMVNDRAKGIVAGVDARLDGERRYLDELMGSVNRVRQNIATLTAQLEADERQRQELLKTYLPENTRVKELQQKIESERAALAQAQGKIGASQPSGAATDNANPVTDEEQTQIRNIQAMIQNSPDLINSPDQDGKTPLIRAAEKGQLIVAKYLLDHGADVNGRSRNHGDVPLLAAAGYGHKSMVELLVARGADVSGGGLNPLYEAVKNGYQAVAEVLLANKADVNLRSGTDTSGMRPVHVAARDGRTEMLQMLIKHGADVNVANAQGNTPLEFAASMNETKAAKLLLESKAAIEAQDKDGNTPLHEAAERGYADMISLLLDSGAVVDATNNDNTTPLLLAVFRDRLDAARVLLQHKADPNRIGFEGKVGSNRRALQPLYSAMDTGNNEMLKLVLDASANPEGTSAMYWQAPLFYAIDKRNAEAVQLLLDHGADPNRKNGEGNPALRMALGDKRMVPALLAKGADANARDKDGRPPLFLISDVEIGRWLIDHKADVNARADQELTPIMWQIRYTNYVELLLNAGARVDLQDVDGNTALHRAVFRGQVGAVEMLLAHKANPNIQNEVGNTPLDLAKSGSSGTIRGGMVTRTYGSVNLPAVDEKKIADLLSAAGGLANLPKHDRIEIQRASNTRAYFTKGSHDWNRYSLLEMIAGNYGLIDQDTGGEWRKRENLRHLLWKDYLSFPDFKNVTIYRRTGDSAKSESINVNVEDILSRGDCSRDVWLKWGDVIEIPESDHPVNQVWAGITPETVNALTNCLARQVTVIVKGASTQLKLKPEFAVLFGTGDDDQVRLTHVSFMLRSVLDNSKLVRVSSDLTRVKVTRVDPETKKKQEWVIDATNPTESDLWLRDGDVIDVPEKQ